MKSYLFAFLVSGMAYLRCNIGGYSPFVVAVCDLFVTNLAASDIPCTVSFSTL